MISTVPHIILAGGSGFLGSSLAPFLAEHGYEVVILTRGASGSRGPIRRVNWDARTPGPWCAELEGAAAIINLVGRTVDCRKTDFNRRVILESRVDSVHALAAGCAACKAPPTLWIQSATAHIYGDTADEILDESSPFGQGFAPMVGQAWEKAFADADLRHCRRVVLRTSFVLGRDGGPLPTLARLARLFLGGRIGTGRQYMSWIHEADFHAITLRALQTETMQGAYVITSPNPVTNEEFMRELRQAVHRPWSPPVPAGMVRVGAYLMRTDPELALLGRRCVPTRLMDEGYRFLFPELGNSLYVLFKANE